MDRSQWIYRSWGFLCPVHTPDGTPCGLLNHLTAVCRKQLFLFPSHFFWSHKQPLTVWCNFCFHHMFWVYYILCNNMLPVAVVSCACFHSHGFMSERKRLDFCRDKVLRMVCTYLYAHCQELMKTLSAPEDSGWSLQPCRQCYFLWRWL